VHFSRKPFFVIDTAYYVVPRTELDMRWLYYAMIYHKLGEIDDGSPIPSTTRSAVYPRELEVPDIGEQRAIAAVLGSLDDKIELNQQMNETLEAMAGAIFKSWFVDFDPVHAKAGANDTGLSLDLAALFPSRFGENGLPESWEYAPIIDLAIWDNGAAYKNMHFSDVSDALPVVKIAELKAGITGQTKRTNTDLGERYRIKDRELLFSWSGNPETSIDAFVWVGGEAWLNQHIFAVRENGRRDKAYLYSALRYLKPEFTRIAGNKQTTGLGHVTKGDMKKILLPEPSPAILEAFDAIVTPVFDRFVVAKEQSQTLASLRDLVLPKLMSGNICIDDAENLIGEAGCDKLCRS